MLGTKMYIDTNKYEFNECIQKIINEINNNNFELIIVIRNQSKIKLPKIIWKLA